MLEQAAVRVPSAQFIQADFTDWQSDAPPDLLFANAALQWAGNHADLLPRLVGQLAEGGVLAVQMPDNLEEPAHLLMSETARLPQWQPQMQAMKNRRPLAEAEEYYDILTAASCSVDIWRTTYYHIMPDAEAIVHWFRATGLRGTFRLTVACGGAGGARCIRQARGRQCSGHRRQESAALGKAWGRGVQCHGESSLQSGGESPLTGRPSPRDKTA